MKINLGKQCSGHYNYEKKEVFQLQYSLKRISLWGIFKHHAIKVLQEACVPTDPEYRTE